MRVVTHLVAIVAVLLLVVGVRTVTPNDDGKAYAGEHVSLNVLQMQTDYGKALPELTFRDMTFALD